MEKQLSHEECAYNVKELIARLRSSNYFQEHLRTCIDQHIENNKQTQKELAHSLSIDPSTLTRWQKHERTPQDAGMVFLLCKGLKLEHKEAQYLLCAWLVDRALHDLEPFVEAMMRQSPDPIDIRFIRRLINSLLILVLGEHERGNDIY